MKSANFGWLSRVWQCLRAHGVYWGVSESKGKMAYGESQRAEGGINNNHYQLTDRFCRMSRIFCRTVRQWRGCAPVLPAAALAALAAAAAVTADAMAFIEESQLNQKKKK